MHYALIAAASLFIAFALFMAYAFLIEPFTNRKSGIYARVGAKVWLKQKARSVFHRGFVPALCALLCFSLVMPTTGCNQSPEQVQKTIATLTQTLGNAAANVASLEGNAELGAQLQKDTAAAVAAVNNWKNGSAVDDVIEALGIVQDDLNLFPGAGPYVPLIDIAIATVQTLLSLIPPSAVTPATQAKMARRASHTRTVFLGHPAPKTDSDFKKQWNMTVKAHPELAQAAIK